MEQVEQVMGKPPEVKFVENTLLWKYRVQVPWKGQVPYYFAFTKDNGLVSWTADEEEYRYQRQQWQNFNDTMQRQQIIDKMQ